MFPKESGIFPSLTGREAEDLLSKIEIHGIKLELLKKCDEIERNGFVAPTIETTPTCNTVCRQELHLGITDTKAASVHDASTIISTYYKPQTCYISSISETDKILLNQGYEKNHIALTCGISHEL